MTNRVQGALLLIFALTSVFLMGCGSTRTAAPHRLAGSPAAYDASSLQAIEKAIRPWKGTPYEYGGTTRRGVDCSAFVAAIYDEVYGRRIPRMTRQQVGIGRRVDRRKLAPGDLVFFRPPESKRHVGIYLAEGRFAHASTSRGVTVSSLASPYWASSFWTARRLPAASPEAEVGERKPTGSEDYVQPPAASGW